MDRAGRHAGKDRATAGHARGHSSQEALLKSHSSCAAGTQSAHLPHVADRLHLPVPRPVPHAFVSAPRRALARPLLS